MERWAQPVAAAIEVHQGAVIGSDETSARVARSTWGQWVFLSVVRVSPLIETATLRGAGVCDALVNPIGLPVPPFVLAQNS